MSRFKVFLSVLLSVLMLVVFVACGNEAAEKPSDKGQTTGQNTAPSTTESKEPTKEPTKVLFWDMQNGGENYFTIAAEHAAKITNDLPNITIEYQGIPWANRYETFSTAVAANEGPDMSTGGGYQSFQFYSMGEIMEINSIVDEWRADGTLDKYDMSLIDYFKVGDAQVGIPFNRDPRFILYRKDWFEAAGIEPPKTWDELHAAAKHFTDPAKGIYGIAYPCEGADGNVLFMLWFAMNGSGVWTEDGTTVDWTNPKNVEAIEFIRKMKNEGLMPEGMSAYTNTEVIQLAQQDKVAIVLGMGGNFSSQVAANGGDQKWALLTTPPAGPSANGKNGYVTAINAIMAYSDTKHPEETKAALKWWCENQIDLFKNPDAAMGGLPARNDWLEDEEYLSVRTDPFTRQFVKEGLMETVHTLVFPAANIKGWLTQNSFDAERWWSGLSQAILTSNESAEQLLQKRQDDALKLLKEFGEAN
ncbi:MAG: ABC transporter substrate-binding protein [Bacillota bacterium]